MTTFKVVWIDRKREPQFPPDRAFPDGKDCDVSHGVKPACKATLPYPAKRCGLYYVECRVCGKNAVITTAGRADDPRSVTLACDKPEQQH